MDSIAIVTTCKGRLQHLRETLPLMAAQGADELVVVDYGCPDGAGAWAERHVQGVRTLRVDDDPGFCVSRARNLGAASCASEWIAFVDADVKLSPGWIDWFRVNARPGRFYRTSPVAGRRRLDHYGTIACARRDFERVGGFDEAMRGWGWEDIDLYTRLEQSGVIISDYPGELVEAIWHGDDLRTRWHSNGNRALLSASSQCYLSAKQQLTAFRDPRRPLDLETRISLFESTRRQIAGWNGDASKPLILRYAATGSDWLPPPYAMRKELRLTIEVRLREAPDQEDASAP